MARSTPRMPRWLGACILGLGLVSSASAVPIAWYDVQVDPAFFTGSRSDNGGGLVAANALEGTSISWVITDNGNGTWTYSYTFPEGDSPSHFILELSESCISPSVDTDCVQGFTGSVEYDDAWGPAPSNPSFPAGQSINGIKFDVELGTYTFTSDRNPVWGSFYIKKASDGYAYNEGLATGPGTLSETPLPWIPRPNGGTEPPNEVPEPGTLALLGAGLLGLGVFQKTRLK